jgi:hypothetical protein
MTDLRDKIAFAMYPRDMRGYYEQRDDFSEYLRMADTALALPEIAQAQARIDELTEALQDMTALFSADGLLRKGVQVNAALALSRIGLEAKHD